MIQEIAKTFGVKSELRDTWTWLQAGPINTDGAHNPVTSRYYIYKFEFPNYVLNIGNIFYCLYVPSHCLLQLGFRQIRLGMP